MHLLTINGLVFKKYTNIIKTKLDINGSIIDIIPKIKYKGSSDIYLFGIKFNVKFNNIYSK